MGKDKNKPKGAMSAYNFFLQVIREEHKKKHPNEPIHFAEFSKKCSEKWKSMSEKEKKRFEDMAAKDRARYNQEMVDYVPIDGKKKKAKKDPNKPKKALSAFFMFCNEERPKVKENHPDWKVGDIAKELGQRWEKCTNRTKFEKLSEADKKRYEKEMEKYNAKHG